MIRYRKTIEIASRNGLTRIKTDCGQTYETSLVRGSTNPWTDWWNKQNPSEWRRDQKDYLLDLVSRAYRTKHYTNEIHLYVVYERGKGYNQPHDVAFARIPNENIWILSTEQHTWIEQCQFENFAFSTDTALPSIKEQSTRDVIWDLYESFRSAYA